VRASGLGVRCLVSIHAPLRGATISQPVLIIPRVVSIHAPLRGATGDPLYQARILDVSIHAPLRGATHQDGGADVGCRGFNPRTPAGCDVMEACSIYAVREVSIHAPLRGATGRCWVCHRCGAVSIHAPLRGATRNVSPSRQRILSGFNPRTPAGCDCLLLEVNTMSYVVSIHAPLRGATIFSASCLEDVAVSIHAPLRGATGEVVGRQGSPLGFNPRTPAGCDRSVTQRVGQIRHVSIHAPLRGATAG